LTEQPWPEAAIFPTRGLSEGERSIEPRLWQFVASDGYPLRAMSFEGASSANGRVVVLHGVQSHAGWYTGFSRRLAAAGFEVHCPDRRGSGANTGNRGHAESARRLVDDVVELIESMGTHDKGRPGVTPLPVCLVGISWGAKLAVAVAAGQRGLIQAIALVCPGLHPRVGISRRERLGVGWALLTGRGSTTRFPIPLSDPALFTDDSQGRAFIAADPLSLRDATASLLFASRMLDAWVARGASRLDLPVLLILAEHDRIVDNHKTRSYLRTIASRQTDIIEYACKHHTLEFDNDSATYAADLSRWLKEKGLSRET
jgi:alpha-beta hydrolase superfamily lysophospholipase